MGDNKTANKIFTGVITAIIISLVGNWYHNDLQTKKNSVKIDDIREQLKTVDEFHNLRLQKLEQSRDTMGEIYVTRREFNKIMELQNEKMDMINKNIEKLLDLQLKK